LRRPSSNMVASLFARQTEIFLRALPSGRSAHETVHPSIIRSKMPLRPLAACCLFWHSPPPPQLPRQPTRAAPTSAPGRSFRILRWLPAPHANAAHQPPLPHYPDQAGRQQIGLNSHVDQTRNRPRHRGVQRQKKPNVGQRPPAPSTRRFRCRGFRPRG
jgi:hypothetical protein